MEKIDFKTAVGNLKKNILLLISAGAALCLFLAPSLASVAVTGCIFLAVCVAVGCGLAKPEKTVRPAAAVCAVLFAVMGFGLFHTNWKLSSKLAALAGALGTEVLTILGVVGLAGCVAGLYGFWVLGQWGVSLACTVAKENLPEQRKDLLIKNLKTNLLFVLSGIPFLIYSFPKDPHEQLVWLAASFFALLLYGLIATQCPSVVKWLKEDSLSWHLFYAVTAAGICWSSQGYFYKSWIDISASQWPSVVVSVAAVPFLYVWVTFFWRVLRKQLQQMRLFSELGKKERVFYGVLLLALCALAIFAFLQTEAFYRGDVRYDVVYTSDSIDHLRHGVLTSLWTEHNCIKQPLFTLIAAPTSGAAFFAGNILGLSAVWRALLIDYSQIALILCTVLILAKMLHLDGCKRVCFAVLFLSGYTALLFTMMMEQFVVSLFWLIVLLYQISEEKKPHPLVFAAAGGTIVTNLACTPLVSSHVFTRNYKDWILDMCRYGAIFVAAWVGSGRIVTLLNLATGVGSELTAFGGASLSLLERIGQYTVFIKNYFLVPEAGPATLTLNGLTWESWQLMPATGLNLAGVVIFVLALLSVWVNREKRSSLLAGCWVLFSAFALGCLGWGSVENGMLLYSLYFGWPFATLLFQLVEKLEERLRVRFVIPAVCFGFAAWSLLCNIPALCEMIDYLASVYPG